jgi:hypothetical protein
LQVWRHISGNWHEPSYFRPFIPRQSGG